jgi:hypothetical protein
MSDLELGFVHQGFLGIDLLNGGSAIGLPAFYVERVWIYGGVSVFFFFTRKDLIEYQVVSEIIFGHKVPDHPNGGAGRFLIDFPYPYFCML